LSLTVMPYNALLVTAYCTVSADRELITFLLAIRPLSNKYHGMVCLQYCNPKTNAKSVRLQYVKRYYILC